MTAAGTALRLGAATLVLPSEPFVIAYADDDGLRLGIGDRLAVEAAFAVDDVAGVWCLVGSDLVPCVRDGWADAIAGLPKGRFRLYCRGEAVAECEVRS